MEIFLKTDTKRRLPYKENAELTRRTNIARESITGFGSVDNVIIYDNLYNAVGPTQREFVTGLPGYMRTLLPAIPYACVRETHVVSLTTPAPEELLFSYRLLEEFGGNLENYNIWVLDPKTKSLINLTEKYVEGNGFEAFVRSLVRATSDNLPEFTPNSFFDLVKQLKEGVLPSSRSLVIPFQTVDWHYDVYSQMIDSKKIVLPTSSQSFQNKVLAGQTLVERDPSLAENIPNAVLVDADPEDTFIEADDEERDILMTKFARRIVEEMMIKEALGVSSYLKLDASGGSASTNTAFGIFSAREGSLSTR
ncbi:MAG TPA: hypothetical protein ENI23_06235, partial [bacterium]|nr:hypothetical protein [bacterium]